jgi:hypothetical protein
MGTGNLERDARLTRAIKECGACNEQSTLDNVRDKLPKDFDLLEEELADALAEIAEPTDLRALPPVHAPAPMIAENPDGHSLRNTWAPGSVTEKVSESEPATPDAKLTQGQARAAVEAAHKRLGMARVAVTVARQKLSDTKGKLAAAILAWQQGSDEGTPEQRRMQLVRDHLASEQAKRAGHVATAQPQPGNSVVDRSAAYSRDNTPSGFVRNQFRNGGSHRGAFPKSMRGQSVKA